jgi:hypothetical protein
MRRGPSDSRLENVGSARQTTRVIVDIEVGSEPISGQVDAAGKRTELFVGWSTLAELLEEARSGKPHGGDKQSHVSGRKPCAVS